MVEASVMVLHAVFADYTRSKFGWDQKAVGFGMAFSGALSIVADLLLMPVMLRTRSLIELSVAMLGAVLIAAGLLLMLLASELAPFLLGLAALSLGNSLFKAAAQTILMARASRDQARLPPAAPLDAPSADARERGRPPLHAPTPPSASLRLPPPPSISLRLHPSWPLPPSRTVPLSTLIRRLACSVGPSTPWKPSAGWPRRWRVAACWRVCPSKDRAGLGWRCASQGRQRSTVRPRARPKSSGSDWCARASGLLDVGIWDLHLWGDPHYQIEVPPLGTLTRSRDSGWGLALGGCGGLCRQARVLLGLSICSLEKHRTTDLIRARQGPSARPKGWGGMLSHKAVGSHHAWGIADWMRWAQKTTCSPLVGRRLNGLMSGARRRNHAVARTV